MPTDRGWALAVGGAAFIVAGRLFGVAELYELGAALIVLVLAALILIRARRQQVDGSRVVAMPRAAAGSRIKVEVRIKNLSRRRSPLFFYKEQMPERLGGTAHFAVAPIGPDSKSHIRFEVVAEQRGLYRIGPGWLSFTDPFGLARAQYKPIETTPIVVYPRIVALTDNDQSIDSLTAGRLRMAPSADATSEFFTIREYQEGDGLRKVHWRSTARMGKFMIRQEEQGQQAVATILVDNQADHHGRHPKGRDSFEHTMETAASLINLYSIRNFQVRLLFASSAEDDDPLERFSKGTEHFHRLMDRLAVTGVTEKRGLISRLVQLGAPGRSEGLLLWVTTGLEEKSLNLWRQGPGRYLKTVAIVHPLHEFLALPASERDRRSKLLQVQVGLAERLGMTVIMVGANGGLADAWNQRFKRRSLGQVGLG